MSKRSTTATVEKVVESPLTIVKVCFCCHRVAQADGSWAHGPEPAPRGGPAISHGLCKPCFDRFYAPP